ncbi:MAG: dihydropteroate synthase [Chloroflexota bacterium]
MTDRQLPGERGVVREHPELGGGAATPSFALPAGAPDGLPGAPAPLAIGSRTFEWGRRTFVMGVLNVTPDSFSGDGLLADGDAADPVARAVERARRMVADGADILDVGGASSRPGHAPVPADEEAGRVVPVIAAIAAGLPDVPVSVDTTSPAVAAAALDAGAHLLNDVWGVAPDDALARLAAERGVPIVLMHNREQARYRNVVAEVVADLQRALDRALDAGVAWDDLIVDPGFGFGKTPDHNLALMTELEALLVLGRPILLGTSRKSTLGKLLDLPPDRRLEATVATTVLGVAAGVDIVRVHDVLENVRAARVADAIIRGWRPEGWAGGGTP